MRRLRRAIRGSRSMLDGCGIETAASAARRSAFAVGRDRCSMAVESRHPRRAALRRSTACVAIDARWLWDRDMPRCGYVDSVDCGRDRCSMAVESRQHRAFAATLARGSRSMLDGCGIETSRRAAQQRRTLSRSMLDGCGIETVGGRGSVASITLVAIDARWLWNRDATSAGDVVARRRDRCSMAVESRHDAVVGQRVVSRSMLDGCGIETRSSSVARRSSDRCEVAIDARWLWDRDRNVTRVRTTDGTSRVAIDARWLWNRDDDLDAAREARGDRCSMAVGSRPASVAASSVAIDARWLWDRDCPPSVDLATSRSMLDGCGIETRRAERHSPSRRDRCSMAVGSRL